MLGEIEGKRRRVWQRIRWLDSITDSMDMNLSKLREIVRASLIAQLVKNLLAMQETLVQFLGWEGSSAGGGIGCPLQYSWASLGAQLVTDPPATRETWV